MTSMSDDPAKSHIEWTFSPVKQRSTRLTILGEAPVIGVSLSVYGSKGLTKSRTELVHQSLVGELISPILANPEKCKLYSLLVSFDI